MIRKFVWTGGSTNPIAHLVKWDCTSTLICYGGLEIGSFRQKNIALLTKWFWRFSKEETSLWRRLIVAIYDLEENGWSTKDPNRGKSYRLWAGIFKHKETFNFSAFVLGEQKSDFGRTNGVPRKHLQKNSLTYSLCCWIRMFMWLNVGVLLLIPGIWSLEEICSIMRLPMRPQF